AHHAGRCALAVARLRGWRQRGKARESRVTCQLLVHFWADKHVREDLTSSQLVLATWLQI
ncbi:hypothetical protein BDR03DRAFT_941834, partial [Suillus americanus]